MTAYVSSFFFETKVNYVNDLDGPGYERLVNTEKYNGGNTLHPDGGGKSSSRDSDCSTTSYALLR